MTRGIRNNNPVAIDNKTAMAETATANSAGGLCLSSPHHSKAASGTPRGIRNNNPLNLRCSSSPWKGKIDPTQPPLKGGVLIEKDPEFEQFVSMYYGFRAAILTIETYIIKYGCNTIRSIITRWAPPRVRKPAAKADTAPLNQQATGTSALPNTTSCAGGPIWVKENDTENYIKFVCRATGIGGNEPISNHDKRLKDIVWAMAIMESGKGILDYKESLDKAFDDFEPKSVFVKERKKQYAQSY